MAVKEVPAKFVYKCDGCGHELTRDSRVNRPSSWGLLTLEQDACDYQGNPVADGSIRRLLCRSCRLNLASTLGEWLSGQAALSDSEGSEHE